MAHSGLVLLQFLHSGYIFLFFSLVFLGLKIFVLISLEELGLSVLMLIVLVLEVSEFTIKLIKIILKLLNTCCSFLNISLHSSKILFHTIQINLVILDSLFIILNFSCQNLIPLVVLFHFFVEMELNTSESSQLLECSLANLFLLLDELIFVFNLFPEIQILLVMYLRLLTEPCQFSRHYCDLSFTQLDLFEQPNLFIFNRQIFVFYLVQFSNKTTSLRTVFSNPRLAVILHPFDIDLDIFVLLLQVSILVLKLTNILLFVFQVVDFRLELIDEKFKMLGSFN